MNGLAEFSFQGVHGVRVQVISGEPWFCLRDVCKALSIENPSDLIAKQLDRAGVEKIYLRSGGQQRQLTFVNEPNLYRVIFRSNKPEARQFQDWVFNEVLPAIRKTGTYCHAAAAPVEGSEPLNGNQQRELEFIVGQIAKQFHFKGSWVTGIWYAIRRTTGTKSPAPIKVKDLPAVRRELLRVINVAEQTKAGLEGIERDVVREVIRGRKSVAGVFGKNRQDLLGNVARAELPAQLEMLVEQLADTGQDVQQQKRLKK